tara:strand:- start:4804 stop:5781 length:978 start_codon:yes stop_codon:yes gene_type:complete
MAVPIFQTPPASAFAPTPEQLYGGVQGKTLTDAAMTALSLYPATRLGGAAISNAPKIAPYLERLMKAAGYSRKYDPLKRGAGGRMMPRDPKDFVGINPNRAAVTSGLAALGIGGLSGDAAPAVGGDSTGTVPVEDKSMTTSAIDANAEKLKADRGDDTNWFDALNERVDLMAMGAAMLSGSGSGMGTAANLGRGLQAGIAARTGQAKAAEDKQYKDAALLLDSMRARAAMQAASGRGDIYKQYGAKIDDLGADLVGLRVPQDKSEALAKLIFSSTNGNVMNMNPNARNTFLEDIIDRSTGIFEIGEKDVKLKDVRPAIVSISEGL